MDAGSPDGRPGSPCLPAPAWASIRTRPGCSVMASKRERGTILTSEVIDPAPAAPNLGRVSTTSDLTRQETAPRDFGSLLRHWRQSRRLSQIELAGDASVSARHLCFLETRSSKPSRD